MEMKVKKSAEGEVKHEGNLLVNKRVVTEKWCVSQSGSQDECQGPVRRG